MKKLIALLLTLMMVFTMAAGAMAEDPDFGEILDGLTEEQKRELLFELMEDMFGVEVEDPEAEGFFDAEAGEDDGSAVPEEEPSEEEPSEEEPFENELDRLFDELFGGSSEEEEKKAPVYNSFGEHLAALIFSVNPNESDIQLTLTSFLGTYLAVLGKTEDGFYGKLYSDENEIGALQVNQEAVYLSTGDKVMGVKTEELKKVLENMMKDSPDDNGPGFSREQMQKDAQTVIGWGRTLWEKVQPSFILEQVSENERRVTVDSAAFADAFVAGMEEVMADPAFDSVYNRYVKLASNMIKIRAQGQDVQLPDAETFKAVWAASRYATKALVAQISMTMNLKREENGSSFTFEGQAPMGENSFAILRCDGRLQGLNELDMNMALFFSDDPDNAKAVAHFTAALDGKGLTFHADAEGFGQTAAVDGKAAMNLFAMNFGWDYRVVMNGAPALTTEGVVDLQNKNIDIKAFSAAKQMNFHLSFDGKTLKVETNANGQQMSAAVWCEEIDANNMKVHVSVQDKEYELLASIVPQNPEEADEPEVLTLTLSMTDQPETPMGMLVIGTIPAQEDPALDQGTVEWVDADMLPMMVMMMMPGMMAPPAVSPVPAA